MPEYFFITTTKFQAKFKKIGNLDFMSDIKDGENEQANE